MPPIAFATTNPEKLAIAQVVCSQKGLQVQQVNLDIDEIQGENPEAIIKDKAARAYKQYKAPIVVSDDSWSIPALNGFPGAYMKSINYWFRPEDFLHLMDGIEDRTIILSQYLAYINGKETIIFKNDIPGVIIEEVRGKSDRSPNMTVITLDGDNGRTIAEVFGQDRTFVEERYKSRPDAWHELLKWYEEKFS